MNKILVEIKCPATSASYDFWVSKRMKLGEAKKKIIAQICAYEKNDELFEDESQVLLLHDSRQIFVETGETVQHAKIKSGDCIYIV